MTDDPTTILADAWQRLRRGRAEAQHPFRTAALATADALGRPDARTVVLRRVDENARTLDFQTDYRSPKYSGLQRNAAATWLFWDAGDQVQLRVQTSVVLHTTDAVADAAWADVPAAARGPYASAVMPGGTLPGPGQPPMGDGDGRVHFVVARCSIDALEWLRKADIGWHRLRFTWPHGTPQWHWLAP